MTRDRLPARREAETFNVTHITPDGVPQEFILTIGRKPDGKIAEVFADVPYTELSSGKNRYSLSTMAAQDVALIISIALQHGVPLEEMADSVGKGEVNLLGKPHILPHTIVGTILNTLRSVE